MASQERCDGRVGCGVFDRLKKVEGLVDPAEAVAYGAADGIRQVFTSLIVRSLPTSGTRTVSASSNRLWPSRARPSSSWPMNPSPGWTQDRAKRSAKAWSESIFAVSRRFSEQLGVGRLTRRLPQQGKSECVARLLIITMGQVFSQVVIDLAAKRNGHGRPQGLAEKWVNQSNQRAVPGAVNSDETLSFQIRHRHVGVETSRTLQAQRLAYGQNLEESPFGGAQAAEAGGNGLFEPRSLAHATGPAPHAVVTIERAGVNGVADELSCEEHVSLSRRPHPIERETLGQTLEDPFDQASNSALEIG